MPPCGAADDRPAATALPHQAVCVQRRIFQNSNPVGACVPGARRTKRSCLCPPEGYYPMIRRASPVTGVWGPTPPVRGRWPEGPEGVGNAAYERLLREGAHRRRPPTILWCLSDRSERHPPRRAESSLSKAGSLFNYKSRQSLLPSPDTLPEPDDPKSASCGPDQRPPGLPSAPRRSAG